MNIRSDFRGMKCYIENFFHIRRVLTSSSYEEQRIKFLLIKKTHSIEKGFCLENVKEGFGLKKIEEILCILKKYAEKEFDRDAVELEIAVAIISDYFSRWDAKGYQNEKYMLLKNEFHNYLKKYNIKVNREMGGAERRVPESFEEQETNFKALKHILRTRDSIRDFCTGEVSIDKIKEAIELAQTAPSACNRQPSRVYILGRSQYHLIKDWLEGVGGFQDKVDKWLILTSDIAAYNMNELGQWIVSGSIFAGYLALILHGMGLGACIIQRNVMVTDEKIRDRIGIPYNEQVVCCIALGKRKEEYLVPIAGRKSADGIIKIVD